MKNKITLIMIFFLLLNLFSLFNNVFAVSSGQNHSFIFDYNGTTYNITYCNRLDNKSSPYPTYFVLFDKQTNKPYRIIYHHQGQNFKYYYNSSGNLVIQKINNDCYFYVDLTSSNENNFTFGYQDLKYNRSDITIDSSRYAIPYSSKPILNKDTNEEYKEFVWNAPSITTTSANIFHWNFDNIEIDGKDFDLNKGELVFNINYSNSLDNSDNPFGNYESSSTFLIDKNSLFVNKKEENESCFFTVTIPRSELLKNVNLRNGANLNFNLSGSYYNSNLPNGDSNFYIGDSGLLTLSTNYEEDLQKEKESQQRQELIDNQKETNKKLEETNNNIKDTNDSIKEQTETNKGMWESIKTILNLLNPFSKDFFAYKLVELFLDMLKSLFIPSEDFFSNYIDELNQQFSDTFGILYYPIDLLIDFLNRVGSINESSVVISIPQFDISFMGYQATVIPEYSFDFNSILTNDTLKRLHDMYLVFVDILLWLGVVYLASNCIREIVGGMTGEVVDSNVSDEKSYQRYEQYQSNRERYKKEHK